MMLATVVLLFFLFSSEVSFATDERVLYDALFGPASGYNANVRPKRSATEALDINIEYELNQIQALDEKHQVLHMVGFFTTEWVDDFVSWSPEAYGGIEKIIVPPSTVWLPDFGITNSANTFYHDGFRTDFKVEVYYDGYVIWSFGGNFQTMCLLDNTYYPLDLQNCSIDLENWAYAGSQVNLHHSATKIYADNYQHHGIWELTGSEVRKKNMVFASQPEESFPQLKFDMLLKRKSTYYILNILIPCGFVISVALAIFWLPPDAGEKVSFGVTVLLSFSVFQLVIAEQTPQNSDYRPKLSLLVLSIMGLSSFSVIMSILILYLHHKSTATRVPRFLRIFAFKGVAMVMCMRASMPEVGATDSKVAHDDPEMESMETPPIAAEKGDRGELGKIQDCLEYITKRMKDKDKENEILEEWRALGKVIDRVLFWLSLLAIVMICGILMGQPDTSYN